MLQDKNPMTACGGKINDPERYPSAFFRGKRVYFCSQACQRAFESDPDGFMAGEIEHPLDED
jgi:YHS domain-containing protein